MTFGLIRPLRRVPSVLDISLEELWREGYRAIIIDLDNTLVGYRLREPAAEVVAWVRAAQARGFSLAIVSNNVRAWVRSIATFLGIVTYVSNALKPLPFGLFRAVRHLRVSRKEAIVVGDQVFTDVLGARLLGLAVILTEPILREHAGMGLVRWAERRMLGRIAPPSAGPQEPII
ncbi:MAG: YqeG family HAD IIIA-type phosphatase [Candidatus Eremiobacteraeota bacterium]|nr:YqeG family HAD IIIA-type phosphatase [Candidatus Eremiobacteraeota bacterium]MBV8339405.1 YqeG family HAD IIIA-type phosphatase [Candidatus Eremiobacteraeota bacterium]MBV8460083.1 YqeG family HAD IIIA-type phosphatase [Candidatus Eremiobacteraeota bacterium]MBV8668123.1 YqeG family HAD IIIA-type phosphatase [Candidatus Eremiobacteraeota bacterium]MBV8670906.1 YqeG family HAD IIIA-type phosphatase [Candidatus Eremiobacteraeota bacterium]